MGDTLEIFGKEYTNVAGFKAKDSSGNTLTYTRGGGGGITPTGTINITTNGTHDVTNYASANVNVPASMATYTATITSGTSNSSVKVQYKEASYYSTNETFTYTPGDSLIIKATPGETWGSGNVYINNERIASSSGTTCTYTYTLPVDNISISLKYGTSSYVRIVTESFPTLQSKTATPTESAQTITADSGYDGLSSVAVGAISSTYVGSEVARLSSNDIIGGYDRDNQKYFIWGDSGLYADGVSYTVPNGAVVTPATTITANPSINIDSSGKITATTSTSQNITPQITTEGYVKTGTAGTVTVSGSNTKQLTTQAAKTVTPTESSQTAVAAGVYTTGAVTVGAISSTYVGSGVTKRDGDDLTASGATVTVPAGYYASQATKSVASGSAGTPTATKGTVSNHAITVTPSVTNTTGYITGGTKSGTGVTVSASELVSGSQTITENGNNIDVTNLASVNVAISYSTITVSSSNPSGGNNGDIWIKR